MAIMAITAAATAGCASSGGFEFFNTPPTAAPENGPLDRDPSSKRVVIFGHFKNPKVTPLQQWRDIGPGMSEALAQTVLNHGDFDVWIDPPLARRVEALVDESAERRAAEIAEIRRTHTKARFVVYGTVTDFQHTTDITPELRRRGHASNDNEAIVALQLNIFDLDAERVVASDHVLGTAASSETSAAKLYDGVAFGSYVFWSTPLGEASTETIAHAMGMLNRVVPPRDDSIRITRVVSPRQVRVASGPYDQLARGDRFFVCRAVEDGDKVRYEPLHDVDTGAVLEAQLLNSARIGSTAWITGKVDVSVDLRGAVLMRDLPGS